MTVWFEIDGIDLAVTGEHVKGYTSALDQFRISRVCVRGPSQNIKAALKEGFLKRVVARAVVTARHPVPIPYDVKGG
jgi:hypothetical protein